MKLATSGRQASLCLVLSLLLSVPGVAAWRLSGPFGGSASALAIDPQNRNLLLAGSRDSLLFRSDDGARLWRLLPFPRGTPGHVQRADYPSPGNGAISTRAWMPAIRPIRASGKAKTAANLEGDGGSARRAHRVSGDVAPRSTGSGGRHGQGRFLERGRGRQLATHFARKRQRNAGYYGAGL